MFKHQQNNSTFYIRCDNEDQKKLLISMIFIKDRVPPAVVKIALKNLNHLPIIIAVVVVAAAFAINQLIWLH